MPSDYDPTEFIDGDLQTRTSPSSSSTLSRAPTREEVDTKVVAAQQRLADLMREKEEVERARAALEETRRRQSELQTGRNEMIQNLTRGLALLQEAEFTARRDAEQMAKAMTDMRDALVKVEAINEESWTRENFQVELTRALTMLENARMEWNSARLKFPRLSEQGPENDADGQDRSKTPPTWLGTHSFGELSRLGLALTWPILAAALVVTAALLCLLLRR